MERGKDGKGIKEEGKGMKGENRGKRRKEKREKGKGRKRTVEDKEGPKEVDARFWFSGECEWACPGNSGMKVLGFVCVDSSVPTEGSLCGTARETGCWPQQLTVMPQCGVCSAEQVPRAHVPPSFFLSFPVPQTGCGNAVSEPGGGRGMKEEHVIVLEGSFCTMVRQGCEQQQPSEGSSI